MICFCIVLLAVFSGCSSTNNVNFAPIETSSPIVEVGVISTETSSPMIETVIESTENNLPEIQMRSWRGWIAFVSDHEGPTDIYLISPESGEIIGLGLSEFDPSPPAWSPDWEMLSFRGQENNKDAIYVVDLACIDLPDSCASKVVKLSDLQTYNSGHAWSLDGKTIAMRPVDPKATSPFYNLGFLDVETQQVIRLDIDGWDPSWRPGGNQVIFTTTAEAGYSEGELAVYSFIDSSLIRILPGELDLPNAVRADWSPDGREIVFVSVFGDLFYNFFPRLFIFDFENSTFRH
jgi:Tol biopolymer transport system component